MRLGSGSLSTPSRDRWTSLAGGALLIIVGIVLGVQYLLPDKRVLAVLVAMIVFGVAWRLSMIMGLGLLVMVLPYPKGTVFGNTNLALMLLLLVLWFLRAAQRQSPGPTRTPLDIPIAGLLITYIVSFYNITDPSYLAPALQNTQLMVAGMLMFYLIVSNVRTETDLRRLHGFMLLSAFVICLIAFYELNHPGGYLVRGWIDFPIEGEEFARHNVRVGGPFTDYELLSEYCALTLLLVTLWLSRARALLSRVAIGGLFLLVTFTLFTTVTRGSIVSLSLALAYMAWIMRRRIRVVPITILLSAIVAGFLAMNYYVANFTRSGDLLGRLLGTEFYGVVPDTRREAWAGGWERFLEHPILGHGPFYAKLVGTRTWNWPHNGYLYIANLVGIVGLAFFLWMIWKLWVASKPRTDTLTDPSYTRSYLLVAHLQLLLFIINQIKIDFLRNPIYQFQVWLMFASITAAYMILVRGGLPAPRNGHT
jgi:O-antigen ligase